jgi:hypothetical protein
VSHDGPAESGVAWYRAARMRHHIPIDGNAEGQGDLLRDPWTPPARVPLFHVDDGGDDALAGPLGARLIGCFDEKSRRYFRCISAR